MSSKKHEVYGTTIWFPSHAANKALWIHYNKRSRTLELTAMGTVEYFDFYRMGLNDFLRGLGVTAEVAAEVLA